MRCHSARRLRLGVRLGFRPWYERYQRYEWAYECNGEWECCYGHVYEDRIQRFAFIDVGLEGGAELGKSSLLHGSVKGGLRALNGPLMLCGSTGGRRFLFRLGFLDVGGSHEW